MNKTLNKSAPVLQAFLAAVLFGISIPFSKLLLTSIPPIFLAGLLYFGAGLGMSVVSSVNSKKSAYKESSLAKSDLRWVIVIVILNILAPILLLFGLAITTSANASLLFNFEIAATALAAAVFFKEALNKRIITAILLILTASIILSFETSNTLNFSAGSLLVLGACICWGFENNCTRNISGKNPAQIVIVKGLFAGGAAIVIGLLTEKISFGIVQVFFAMALGFFSYGLSVFFYIKAQRDLGAARTSAYYAVSPFVGVLFSFIFFGADLGLKFIIAFIIMSIGTYLSVTENHSHTHTHEAIEHEHRHSHDDGHHNHNEGEISEEHTHLHKHNEITHTHKHTPDIHHRHKH